MSKSGTTRDGIEVCQSYGKVELARSPNSFSRRGSTYKPTPPPTVLVICEDSKSGKSYLQDAAQHYRVSVPVRVTHCGKTDPIGIVREAIAEKKNFVKIFCVIDRDTHPSYDQAIRLARRHKEIYIISSFPCSEFWYLLHFVERRKSYVATGGRSPGELQLAALLIEMPDYKKGMNGGLFTALLPGLADAKERADRILEAAKADGNFNPSTEIHTLLKFFEDLAALESI